MPVSDVALVFGALDVFAQFECEFFQSLGRVGQEEQAPPMVVGHDGIHVDANQNANVGNLFEIGPKGEVAGSAQIADEGVKPFDVRVVLKNTLKLFE